MNTKKKKHKEIKKLRGNVKYFVILFLISILVGFVFAKKENSVNNLIIQNVVARENDSGFSYDENVLETSFQEEKIKDSTKLILKKYYLDCNHNIEREVELPNELVNFSKEELEKEFKEWKIEKFSEEEVILYKKIYGLCDEHFLILSGNEFVEVYELDEDYDKELYEITNISIEYLAEEDLEKLKEGIYVYGIAELNSTLENFE